MEMEVSCAPVGEVVLQAARDALEGNFIPGNIGLAKQPGFQTFLSRSEVGVEQTGTVEQKNLVVVRDVDEGKERCQFDAGAGFFLCFAQGGLACRFAVFHETSGECPSAKTRFDGAAAEQDVALPFGNAADDDFWVLVVNRRAGRADVAGHVVAGGNSVFEGSSAFGAVFHTT